MSQLRNHIQVPFAFSVIESLVARQVQASFSSSPYVEFEPTGSNDAASARKNTALINAQLEDCDSVLKAVDYYLTANMYGTAIARYGWRTDRQLAKFRTLNKDNGQEQVIEGRVTTFDGPTWDVVDLLDFWPQPGIKRIEDMEWAMERYYHDYRKVEAKAKLGIFDMDAVRRLKDKKMPANVVSAYDARISVYRTQTDWDARRTEQHSQPIELVDMIGYVPDEYATNGYNMRIWTVANNQEIIRDRPFQHFDQMLPWLSYTPQSDPHYFHGVGKIESIEKLQYVVNRWASQKADALDLRNDPMWIVNRQAGVDTQNLFSRVGRVIGVDGPVDDSVIRPLVPDSAGLEFTEEAIQRYWLWIQQATGAIEDTVMGMPSTGRQTKAEFVGRQENILTRQMMESRIAEASFLEKLATRFRNLNRQLLTLPKEVRLVGADAQTDPITGLPIPQESATVTLEDVNSDFRARARGATQMLSKQARQQNLMGLLQVMQANPVAMQAINWTNMLKYTFRVFDLPNTNEFFNPADTGPPAINQMGMEAGGAGAPGISLASVLGQGQFG